MSDPRPTARSIVCDVLCPDEGVHVRACDLLTADLEARDAASDAREDRLREVLRGLLASYSVAPVDGCGGGCGSLLGAGCLAADFARARRALAAIPPRSDR